MQGSRTTHTVVFGARMTQQMSAAKQNKRVRIRTIGLCKKNGKSVFRGRNFLFAPRYLCAEHQLPDNHPFFADDLFFAEFFENRLKMLIFLYVKMNYLLFFIFYLDFFYLFLYYYIILNLLEKGDRYHA